MFVVDLSGSMKGKLLENTKKSLLAALAKLGPEDTFNIIAFNSESYLFSPSLRPAIASCIEEATQWINANFVADGGTNILLPLHQVICLFCIFRFTQSSRHFGFSFGLKRMENECKTLKGWWLNTKNLKDNFTRNGLVRLKCKI